MRNEEIEFFKFLQKEKIQTVVDVGSNIGDYTNDIIISNEMCVDYSLLFHSKYKIISASTFSWWASYLSLENSAIIIAPDRWMNYNKNIINDDIFIPNDIRTNRFIYI